MSRILRAPWRGRIRNATHKALMLNEAERTADALQSLVYAAGQLVRIMERWEAKQFGFNVTHDGEPVCGHRRPFNFAGRPPPNWGVCTLRPWHEEDHHDDENGGHWGWS